MTNLVTTFAADDRVASCAARCRIVADAWLGPGSTTAVATWDDYHALINPVLAAIGLANISAGNSGQIWADRMNALNNVETVVTGLGALAWWSADRVDLMTLSGSNILSWADSLHGYAATQDTGSLQPLYSATSFNGSPGVTSDGLDDNLICTTAGLLAALPAGSVESSLWIVAQQDALASDSSERSALSYGGSSSLVQRGVRRVVSGGVNRGRAQAGNGSVSITADGTVVNFSSRHVVRARIIPTLVGLSIDDSAEITNAVVPATTVERLRLFASAGTSAALFWNGKIRDAIVTGAQSTAQATYLRNYLKSRRAL